MTIARAIDVGYGNTKSTYSTPGGAIKCGLFPSMSHWSTVDPAKVVIGEKRETVAVLRDETFHEVGPSFAASKARYRATHMHDGFIGTPEYRASTKEALHYRNEDTIHVLVPGLPGEDLVTLQHETRTTELIATYLASLCIGWALAHGIDPAQRAGATAPRALAGHCRTACQRTLATRRVPREGAGGLRKLLWQADSRTVCAVRCGTGARCRGERRPGAA